MSADVRSEDLLAVLARIVEKPPRLRGFRLGRGGPDSSDILVVNPGAIAFDSRRKPADSAQVRLVSVSEGMFERPVAATPYGVAMWAFGRATLLVDAASGAPYAIATEGDWPFAEVFEFSPVERAIDLHLRVSTAVAGQLRSAATAQLLRAEPAVDEDRRAVLGFLEAAYLASVLPKQVSGRASAAVHEEVARRLLDAEDLAARAPNLATVAEWFVGPRDISAFPAAAAAGSKGRVRRLAAQVEKGNGLTITGAGYAVDLGAGIAVARGPGVERGLLRLTSDDTTIVAGAWSHLEHGVGWAHILTRPAISNFALRRPLRVVVEGERAEVAAQDLVDARQRAFLAYARQQAEPGAYRGYIDALVGANRADVASAVAACAHAHVPLGFDIEAAALADLASDHEDVYELGWLPSGCPPVFAEALEARLWT